METLTPFPILAYKTGLYGYLDPWIAPEDSFTVLNNAYVYRGALRIRKGSKRLASMVYKDKAFTPVSGTTSYTGTIANAPLVPESVVFRSLEDIVSDDGKGNLKGLLCTGTIVYETGAWTLECPSGVSSSFHVSYSSLNFSIKGLLAWKGRGINEEKLLVLDGNRACVYFGGTMTPIETIRQRAYVCSGTETTVEVAQRWPGSLIPSSLKVTIGDTIYQANSSGVFTPSGNVATLSYDSASSILKFSFTAVPEKDLSLILEAQLVDNYFQGAQVYFVGVNSGGMLYTTNNIDPITLFDGVSLSRPHFSIEEEAFKGFINQIKTCIGLYVFKNRLLLYGAVIENTKAMNGLDVQTLRWSSVPVAGSRIYGLNNFAADVSGYGGWIIPSSDDSLRQITSVRDKLILWYSESVSVLAYTGNWFEPFQATQINNSRSISTSYGGIEYDDGSTSIGGRGLIRCDGVNVTRYDLEIPDEYRDINQENFGHVFAWRDDNENQTWILYPSDSYDSAVNDAALIYNFLENTWCRYIWNGPRYNCLGNFFVSQDKTWESFEETWEEVEDSWDSFYYQKNSPSLIGGGFRGGVFLLNEGVEDEKDIPGTYDPVVFAATTGRWGPFLQKGQKSRFAYLDIYYKNSSENTDAIFSFYADSDAIPSHQQKVVFETTQGTHAFQRILINVTSSLLQLQIESLPDYDLKGEGEIVIYGMVLYASPAGRLVH